MKQVLIGLALLSLTACAGSPLHPSAVSVPSFQDRAVTLRESVTVPQTLQPIPEPEAVPVEAPPTAPVPAPAPPPVADTPPAWWPCPTWLCEQDRTTPSSPCGGPCVDPNPYLPPKPPKL